MLLKEKLLSSTIQYNFFGFLGGEKPKYLELSLKYPEYLDFRGLAPPNRPHKLH